MLYNHSSILFTEPAQAALDSVEYWAFVRHKPESTERKSHVHLFVSSNMRGETLRQVFSVRDIGGDIRPLPFRRGTNYRTWYLYSMHDERYLSQKGLSKKYHYELEDFVCSSREEHERLLDYYAMPLSDVFRLRVAMGFTYESMVAEGLIPPEKIYYYKELYRILKMEENMNYGHN